MIIACPACQTRYVVPDSAIGIEGRTVRCAKCKHSWFQDGPSDPIAATAEGGAGNVQQDRPPPPVNETGIAAAAPPPSSEATAPVSHADGERSSKLPAEPMQEAPASAPAPDFDEAQPPSYARTPRAPLPPVAEGGGDEISHFDHAPPFRPRRHFGRIWNWAAAIFAILALAAVATIQLAGTPSWWPFEASEWGSAQPDLQLSFPPDQQSWRELSNDTSLFSARIIIRNTAREPRDLPPVLIVMLDEAERQVFSWVVQPPQSELAPGESVTIDEARTDVPRSAVYADVGWAPL